MASYQLRRKGLGVACLLAGVVLAIIGFSFEGPFSVLDVAGYAIGLSVAGIFAVSSSLFVGPEGFGTRVFGFSRMVRFSEVRSLRLRATPGLRSESHDLLVGYDRAGRAHERAFRQLEKFSDHESFLKDVQMLSGKKLER